VGVENEKNVHQLLEERVEIHQDGREVGIVIVKVVVAAVVAVVVVVVVVGCCVYPARVAFVPHQIPPPVRCRIGERLTTMHRPSHEIGIRFQGSNCSQQLSLTSRCVLLLLGSANQCVQNKWHHSATVALREFCVSIAFLLGARGHCGNDASPHMAAC